MKKTAFLLAGSVPLAWQSASAQYLTNVLFTTANDFSLWAASSGASVAVDTGFSSDNNTVNGLGNTGGGTGTGNGSLAVTIGTFGSYGEIATAPSQDGNAAFLTAIDPGCDPGSSTSVAYSGTYQIVYSLLSGASLQSGSYFQLGLQMQYNADGYYGPVFWTSTTDLMYQDPNGSEVYRATIPYTINAGNFYGFGFGLMFNSDYQSAVPFHVDEITSLTPVPEPSTMGLAGLGMLGLAFWVRRR